jgi:hypothetical protein
MKKIIFLAVFTLFIIISFTSCKKDRNCVCASITDSAMSFTTVIYDTKGNATSECSAKSATLVDPTSGQTYGVECVIK